MKIAIIIPNIIESTPYLKYYTDVFERNGVDYEYICWDRNHFYPPKYSNSKMKIYDRYSPESNTMYKKLIDFWFFSRFVIKYLNKKEFDYLTIHTIVCAIFLERYLKRNYLKKYVFDIRDYSQIYPLVKIKVSKIIKNASLTIISSIGYKSWLPAKFNYIIGHNVRKLDVENALEKNINKFSFNKGKKEIVVLTIGQIRDFSSNSKVIASLGNKNNISVVFAGDGLQKNNLESFSKESDFKNVYFSGWYDKNEERDIVNNADFINIVLPSSPNFRTQLGNRFYLSLVYRKPMIVNIESIQAKFVSEYKLGIVLKPSDQLNEKLQTYITEFNEEEFENGCLKMLEKIRNDIADFENKIIGLIS